MTLTLFYEDPTVLSLISDKLDKSLGSNTLTHKSLRAVSPKGGAALRVYYEVLIALEVPYVGL